MKDFFDKVRNLYSNIDYYEGKTDISVGKYILAEKLCEKGFYEDYIIYENKENIFVGIGKYIEITVYKDVVVLSSTDEEFKYKTNNINLELSKIFKKIPMEKWRAYGIANFSLAYYNNDLPLDKENSYLIKIFIPQIELEINAEEILFRAIKLDEFNRINDSIKDIENKFNNYNCLDNIERRERILPEKYINQNTEEYKDKVSKAIEEIRDKKYNKVIISRKVNINEHLDMLSSYILGRKNNNPARSYIVNLDGVEVIGYSPETVVEVSSDRIVSTFPLAGTRAITSDEKETKNLKEELLTDAKEIAEHAISVKLAYEELKQVCLSESIVVNEFMEVLNRGTVQHLASRLKGKLKEGLTVWDALKALFPAVTASGIPKKEAIDAISRLEDEPRELYSGSVFTYNSEEELDAALVLRSIYQDKNNTWLRAGAGIVELSSPERELEETCEKLNSVINQLVKS